MIKVPLCIRDLLKRDGSRELTADWDIGNGRMIQADKIRARDSDGLALYDDSGAGIFVKDGGYVGVGTVAPEAELHLAGYAHPELRIESSDEDGGQVVLMGATYWWVLRSLDADLLFYNGSNRLVILGGGNVGIGTSAPETMLHILKGGTQVTPASYTALAVQDTSVIGQHVRMQIIAGTEGQAILNFGDNTDNDIGGIIYDNLTDSMVFRTNNVQSRLFLGGSGNVGIGTIAPGNPLAVNRAADGIIVDFESADVVEGNVSIAGTTTSYNAFMGSHYTQLKDGQEVPPIGSIVIATGEVIPCEANIKVPVMERYYKEEVKTLLKDSIEDDIIEEEVDTGRKQTAYIFINGKVTETEIPVLETVTRVKGKKLKEGCRIDKTTGKIYEKTDRILKVDEEAPVNVTVLERQKIKDGNPVTEIKTKEVSGIERKEYFSYIELASQKVDKRVYGVYHAKLSDDSRGQSFGEDDKSIHQIAALGLYKVRVTDTNGDIAAGDYIQSSTRAGEGERQEDDILRNYTVAKSIIDVEFSKVERDPELGYKWQLIPATLHAG